MEIKIDAQINLNKKYNKLKNNEKQTEKIIEAEIKRNVVYESSRKFNCINNFINITNLSQKQNI